LIGRLFPMMLRDPERTNDFAREYWYGDDR